MTEEPKLSPAQEARQARLKLAGALLFGRGPDGGPEKSWQSKLARAMDTTVSTVASSMKAARGRTFDQRLVPMLRERAVQMRLDADALEQLADEIEADIETKGGE
ncbi:MAG TPA: hypothetical protein VGN60_05210 [Devosia sp.]|jgi:hypothetical protein|nr:hypothetical protein [Devosia sp.]